MLPLASLAVFEQLPMGVLRLAVIALVVAGLAAYRWPRVAPR